MFSRSHSMKLPYKVEYVLRITCRNYSVACALNLDLIPSSQLHKNKSLKPCLHCQLKPNASHHKADNKFTCVRILTQWSSIYYLSLPTPLQQLICTSASSSFSFSGSEFPAPQRPKTFSKIQSCLYMLKLNQTLQHKCNINYPLARHFSYKTLNSQKIEGSYNRI